MKIKLGFSEYFLEVKLWMQEVLRLPHLPAYIYVGGVPADILEAGHAGEERLLPPSGLRGCVRHFLLNQKVTYHVPFCQKFIRVGPDFRQCRIIRLDIWYPAGKSHLSGNIRQGMPDNPVGYPRSGKKN